VPTPTSSVAPGEFRRLMARWATGVSVVTTRDGTVDAGLTVNAFLSVALDPPTVLVSLTREADSTPILERSRAFAVNVLAVDQRAVSERFARTIPPAEKFRDLPVHRGGTGVALLDGTLGNFECRVVDWIPRQDHVLVVGEVVREEVGRDAEPLLFFRAGYATLDGADRVKLPPRAPS
jgi:flavin reductase (DIM6/NTAB) family NADH-FMN oxidoreductase RutF